MWRLPSNPTGLAARHDGSVAQRIGECIGLPTISNALSHAPHTPPVHDTVTLCAADAQRLRLPAAKRPWRGVCEGYGQWDERGSGLG
ncbi:hypothetical protein PNO31109_03617 [Pandoraea nosoerga]|uniref:Uncharacterized protein n=1 Tax=Pandoraea nosoerga TaxID=2508296 RepID=A0A5E4X2V5_9BURK|nr:hypothetical protein PNO31109_03617 [Pandoraea nosoerga]